MDLSEFRPMNVCILEAPPTFVRNREALGELLERSFPYNPDVHEIGRFRDGYIIGILGSEPLDGVGREWLKQTCGLEIVGEWKSDFLFGGYGPMTSWYYVVQNCRKEER